MAKNPEINMRSSVLINDDMRAQRDENRFFVNILFFKILRIEHVLKLITQLKHGTNGRLPGANVRGAGPVSIGTLVGNAAGREYDCRTWRYVHPIGDDGSR